MGLKGPGDVSIFQVENITQEYVSLHSGIEEHVVLGLEVEIKKVFTAERKDVRC
jgi:hypothetical protein